MTPVENREVTRRSLPPSPGSFGATGKRQWLGQGDVSTPRVDNKIVLIVAPNPEPDQICSLFNGDGTIMNPHTRRPEPANFLEVQ
jgi:hypothetical protein